jgi:hypothetical protein
MKIVIPLELIELEEDNYHLTVKSRFEEGEEGLRRKSSSQQVSAVTV